MAGEQGNGLLTDSEAEELEKSEQGYPPGRLPMLGEVLYSIRVPEISAEVRCSSCDTRFHAAGPTGYADEEPICDLCLFTASEPLGMVLALVSKVRAFAAPVYESDDDYGEALGEVGAFGRTYECVAARFGAPRLILNCVFDRST